MKQVPEALSFMLGAWNERDLDKIRSHVDKCMSDKIVFADPDNFVHGKDEFTEMIVRFRKEEPETILKPTSGMDSHNNRFRYTWAAYVDGVVSVKGLDVVQLDENGLVERVDGFFGDLPPLGQ
jgi:hypothetical protein